MKVLLINPPRMDAHRMAKKVHPPLNLLYLATALKNEGHDVDVMDANAADMTPEQVVDAAAASAPGLIGYPLFSDILHQTTLLIRATRRRLPETPIVLGGIHVTADPRDNAERIPEADFFISGYAEQSLAMLVRALETGAGLDAVPSLTHRTPEGIRTNPDNPAKMDINAIPIPDRSLVREYYDRHEYYQVLNARPFDTIVTGRGCPFTCSFCYNAVRPRTMTRSPDSVMDEIVYLYGRGVRFLDVDDDHFTFDRPRAMEIFKRLEREKMDLSLFIKARPNNVDDELIRAAARAGVKIISYGIESGSQRLLDAMRKETNVEDNARVIAASQAAGLQVHTGYLIGYPGETPETIEETIRFARATKPDAVSLQILKPYLGTEVYEQAKADGTLVGSWDPDVPDWPWVRLPWTESRDDLVKWGRVFYRKTYLRTRYAIAFPARIIKNANMRMFQFAMQSLDDILRPAPKSAQNRAAP
ncbi:MAG: B12-binding domain-containing radical SAM protein [Deltaproteobacteria bacterium]|nr:B12-binding domain-containing radical SAM protein [Deltaproteobacteria bacterium]